jgi:hypothetical protein
MNSIRNRRKKTKKIKSSRNDSSREAARKR